MGGKVALIYRRLALLSAARANVVPLARGWECIISGYIGRNSYKVGEYFRFRKEALERRLEINKDGKALVVSVEEVLYPLAMIVAKYDTLNVGIRAPKYSDRLPENTHVSDLYDAPRMSRTQVTC